MGELFNSTTQTFNEDNYNILLKYMTGNANATLATVTTLAETNNNQFSANGYIGTDASVLRAKTLSAGTQGSTSYSAKTSHKDICVRLGGLDWQVMYLSRDKSGNTILTLWLDNNIQDAWTNREIDEGYYYGYVNGGLYSLYSAYDGGDNPYASYPTHMYGSSYINAVTLNNGGVYATSGNTVTTATKSSSSAFALFTMPEYGLTDYIVTPRNVSWQEEQDINNNFFDDGHKWDYFLPNESWSCYGFFDENYYTDEDGWEVEASNDYSSKTYHDSWADSYLWLPSLSETFVGTNSGNVNVSGIWNASSSQLQNLTTGDDPEEYDDYVVSGNEGIGYSGEDIHAWRQAYLRSGDFDNADTIIILYNSVDENDYSYTNCSTNAHAVRPALHLNLTKVYKDINRVSVGELYNSNTLSFNSDNYNILLKYLTGNANATLATATALADEDDNQFVTDGYVGTDASALRANTISAGTQGSTSYSAKTNGKDICVRLGGLDWQAMYLSIDRNNNTILTLWLDDCIQDTWTSLGALSGTTDWQLNNASLTGRIRYVSDDEEFYCEYDEDTAIGNLFSVLVKDEYGLNNYLVTPDYVSWQISQDGGTITPNVHNENDLSMSQWNEEIGTFSPEVPHNPFTYACLFGCWNAGYLWLPSLCELGYSTTYSGLWDASESQKCSTDEYYLRSWIRASSCWQVYLENTGYGFDLHDDIWCDSEDMPYEGLRPALHLNLSLINNTISGIDISDGTISVSPSSSVYNGSVKTPTITVTVNGTTLTSGTDYMLSYTLNGSSVSQIKEVGVYTITATGRGNYNGTLSTTYMVEGGTIASTTINAPNDCVVFKKGDGAKIYLNDNTYRLVLDTDYTVSFNINYSALTGTVLITGIGNYGGLTQKTFTLILLDNTHEIYMAVYAT